MAVPIGEEPSLFRSPAGERCITALERNDVCHKGNRQWQVIGQPQQLSYGLLLVILVGDVMEDL